MVEQDKLVPDQLPFPLMSLWGSYKQKTFCCSSLGWKCLPRRSWHKIRLLRACRWMRHLQVFFPRAAPFSLYGNQEVLCGHINDRSTVLQEKRHLKRLYVSALIISICLYRGRSAFMPAPDIFGDGKLNLVPNSICFIVSQQLYICPPKMHRRVVGLYPSPVWAYILIASYLGRSV